MARDKATAGVEQNLWITCEEGEYTGVGKGRKINLWYTLTYKPRFIPDTPNFASEEAIARSHDATSWQPAAVATPCTFDITGCGNRFKDIMTLLHFLNNTFISSAF